MVLKENTEFLQDLGIELRIHNTKMQTMKEKLYPNHPVLMLCRAENIGDILTLGTILSSVERIFNYCPFLIFAMVTWTLSYQEWSPINFTPKSAMDICLHISPVSNASKIKIINLVFKCGTPYVLFGKAVIQIVTSILKSYLLKIK